MSMRSGTTSRSLPDHYGVLGLSPKADFREIEAAYWRLAFKKVGYQAELNEAYEVLGHEDRRRAYDAQRAEAGMDVEAEAVAEAPAQEAVPPPSRTVVSRLGWPSV